MLSLQMNDLITYANETKCDQIIEILNIVYTKHEIELKPF